VLQRVVVFVRREIDPIEACVALGQLARVTCLLDREPPRAVRTLEVLEAVDRDTRRACRELQQAGLALGRPAPDALPEPLDHLVVHLVPAVVSVLGPVVDVYLGHAADEQLELALIEHGDQVEWDELAEAGHERIKLLLDTSADAVLDDAIHVVLLVVLRHRNIRATRFQLDGDHLAEAILRRGERLVNDVSDVILPIIPRLRSASEAFL
jgi:hypothetical protein